MKIFGIIIILIYLITNLYVGHKLYNFFKQMYKKLNVYRFLIIYSLIVIISIISFRKITGTFGNIIGNIGMIYIGLFAYLLLLFLIKDIINIFIKIPKKTNIILTNLIVIISLTTTIYGVINAKYIKETNYKIKDEEIKNSYTIVLITDIHLGAISSEQNFKKIIRKINKTNPDIVCIVGDMFNDDYNTINKPNELVKEMKKIKTKYGVFMSLGNHDSGKDFDKMKEFIKKSNINLLNDEYVIINNDFILLGRVDATPIGSFGEIKRKNTKKLLKSIEKDMPIIVMDHNPYNIKEYDKTINLLLSGHTHKGQMFPGNIVTKNMYITDYGLYNKSKKYPTTIVSSGAGTWGMPMRVGTSSEVVSIKIN